jgi:type IV fimbrial biogenesis protein FimT
MKHARNSSKLSSFRMRTGNSDRGFTLIELMIVLVILGIILSVAMPGFSELNLRTRLKSYGNNMVSSAYLARGEAIKRNASVVICIPNADADACAGGNANDWEKGWLVIAADGTVLHHQQAAANGFILKTTPATPQSTLTFESSGAVTTGVALRICRKTPKIGSQERVVTISATGRAYVTTTEDATCS